MIFAAGELLGPEALPGLLDGLEEKLAETLAGPPLEAEAVLSALDRLGRALDGGGLDLLLAQYAPPGTREELAEVRSAIDQYEDCLKTMREKEKHLCEQIQLEQFKAVSELLKEREMTMEDLKDLLSAEN